MEPCGSESRPVELAGSRKQVLRGVGRPPLRSVDSQTESLDIEPRKFSRRESSLLTQAGAAPRRRNGLAPFGPTGVPEQGAGTRGSLGNLRDPAVSTDISGSGTGTPTPRSPRPRVPAAGSKQGARVVSPTEGNEGRRDGRTGVGAPHSTVEVGEPFRGTRRREGGAVSRGRWRETWRVHRNPWTCPRNDNG